MTGHESCIEMSKVNFKSMQDTLNIKKGAPSLYCQFFFFFVIENKYIEKDEEGTPGCISIPQRSARTQVETIRQLLKNSSNPIVSATACSQELPLANRLFKQHDHIGHILKQLL